MAGHVVEADGGREVGPIRAALSAPPPIGILVSAGMIKTFASNRDATPLDGYSTNLKVAVADMNIGCGGLPEAGVRATIIAYMKVLK